MKTNKYGIEKDFLIFAGLVLFFGTIFVFIIYNLVIDQQMTSFTYNAYIFNNNIYRYNLEKNLEENKKVYLKDLISDYYIKTMINPFNDNAHCNINDSYGYKKNNNIYITLNCGKYWIIDYSGTGKVNIYKIKNGHKIYIKSK